MTSEFAFPMTLEQYRQFGGPPPGLIGLTLPLGQMYEGEAVRERAFEHRVAATVGPGEQNPE